jgi:hypothetical protein
VGVAFDVDHAREDSPDRLLRLRQRGQPLALLSGLNRNRRPKSPFDQETTVTRVAKAAIVTVADSAGVQSLAQAPPETTTTTANMRRYAGSWAKAE